MTQDQFARVSVEMPEYEDKKISHRKFRRKEATVIISGEYDLLPTRQWEIVEQWDLGGDGKHYCGHSPNEEWYIKLMRK